ncbi:hypothetical protein, partial [Aeromonas veronii]|uniref:hypothetical protein n=1 Tax=Aeromonas veronii TaxID=654 RepID=UPI003D1FF4F5
MCLGVFFRRHLLCHTHKNRSGKGTGILQKKANYGEPYLAAHTIIKGQTRVCSTLTILILLRILRSLRLNLLLFIRFTREFNFEVQFPIKNQAAFRSSSKTTC